MASPCIDDDDDDDDDDVRGPHQPSRHEQHEHLGGVVEHEMQGKGQPAGVCQVVLSLICATSRRNTCCSFGKHLYNHICLYTYIMHVSSHPTK